MNRRGSVLVVVAVLASSPGVARASDDSDRGTLDDVRSPASSVTTGERRDPPRLRYDVRVDLPLTLLGATAWGTLFGLEGRIGPSSCDWCKPSGVDVATRNALHWSNTKGADALSYTTGFALAPLFALGADLAVVSRRPGAYGREWLEDALVMFESIVVALDMNEIMKLAAGRERPFVYYQAAKPARSPVDDDLSFYSGHTTLAFTAAVSAGTVATLKGYRAAPWIWTAGLVLAAGTGYLRMAADKHWLTDVLTGAALGSATGFVVPYLHRPCDEGRACFTGLSAMPVTGAGAALGVRGTLP